MTDNDTVAAPPTTMRTENSPLEIFPLVQLAYDRRSHVHIEFPARETETASDQEFVFKHKLQELGVPVNCVSCDALDEKMNVLKCDFTAYPLDTNEDKEDDGDDKNHEAVCKPGDLDRLKSYIWDQEKRDARTRIREHLKPQVNQLWATVQRRARKTAVVEAMFVLECDTFPLIETEVRETVAKYFVKQGFEERRCTVDKVYSFDWMLRVDFAKPKPPPQPIKKPKKPDHGSE